MNALAHHRTPLPRKPAVLASCFTRCHVHPLPLQVDSEVADAVALDCSYAQCDPESSCYHTHCLEKFLKSMKCERCVAKPGLEKQHSVAGVRSELRLG